MADVNKGGFDEKAIEEDLKKLFELLKCKNFLIQFRHIKSIDLKLY